MEYDQVKELFYPYTTLTETEKKRIEQYKNEHNVNYDDIHVYHYCDPFHVVYACLNPIKITPDGVELFDESVREIQDFVVTKMDTQNRVYIVTDIGGQYEDKWEHVVGVYSTYEKALERAKMSVDMYCVDEKDLPMTWDEYQKYNYGYPDYPEDGYDYNNEELSEYYNTEIDRDGYTKEQFIEMSNAEQLNQEDYTYTVIESYIIDSDDDNFDKKRISVSSGSDSDEKYHISK